jgi:hypothetical protein
VVEAIQASRRFNDGAKLPIAFGTDIGLWCDQDIVIFCHDCLLIEYSEPVRFLTLTGLEAR